VIKSATLRADFYFLCIFQNFGDRLVVMAIGFTTAKIFGAASMMCATMMAI